MNFEHENMYESAQIEETPIRRKGNFSPPFPKEGQGWFVKRCPNFFFLSLPLGGLGWVSKGGAGVVRKTMSQPL